MHLFSLGIETWRGIFIRVEALLSQCSKKCAKSYHMLCWYKLPTMLSKYLVLFRSKQARFEKNQFDFRSKTSKACSPLFEQNRKIKFAHFVFFFLPGMLPFRVRSFRGLVCFSRITLVVRKKLGSL